MIRNSEQSLKNWYNKQNRKPLIIRGARQVGKSYLVRQFVKDMGIPLFEINLEKHSTLDSVFATLDMKKILTECEYVCSTSFSSGKNGGVLFLDEIQAAPNAIAALRYFFEEKPDLPVIAAGSLLEFALSRHSFSMPVGRVEFHYLGPMTFSEFLVGLGEEQLCKYINGYTVESTPSDAAHDRLLMRLREYLLVGGMPEAVREFVATGSMNSVSPVHESIIETYRSDFSKYAALDDLVLLRRVFDFVPSAIGEKFKYVNVDPDSRAQKVKNAFELLTLAGLVAPIRHSSASGIPIAVSADSNVFKPLFLDIGLMNAVSGIRALPLSIFQSSRFINEGKMAEQFVGQQLLYINSTMRPELFYWLREGKKNSAEVDYLIQHGVHIIPVEVKSGKSGTLKSLHRFMADKKGLLAVRFDQNQPSLNEVNIHVADSAGVKTITFKMLSLPLYFAEQCGKLIQEILP